MEEGDLTSDLWLLDFDTMQWSVVSTYGNAAPRPRRGHAMCGSEEDRKIIVCGGGSAITPSRRARIHWFIRDL